MTKPTVVRASASALKYPLTRKMLREAFAGLEPEAVSLEKFPGAQEATVDGLWSLSMLTAYIKGLGLAQTGRKDQLAFVNENQTVGIVLSGAEPHPTKNTWSKYSIEVQARPLSAAMAASSPASSSVVLFSR